MSLPYFPMYPTDFEAKTSHLTLAEDGAYNRLLRICWMTPGCTMPADEAWIMRRARAVSDHEQEAVRAVLAEFFTIENGRYSNARLCREWLAANEAHERRKSAGAKGGKAKSLHSREKTPSNAKAMPKQPEPEPEPEVKKDTDVSLPTKPVRKKCRIPENSVISDAQIRAAEKRGHSMQEAESQFSKFKNDALAKGKMFLDWDRAFITWLDSEYFRPIIDGARNGNAVSDTGRSRAGGRGNAMVDAFAEVAAERVARNARNRGDGRGSV